MLKHLQFNYYIQVPENNGVGDEKILRIRKPTYLLPISVLYRWEGSFTLKSQQWGHLNKTTKMATADHQYEHEISHIVPPIERESFCFK